MMRNFSNTYDLKSLQDSKTYFLLFIIWPFIAFITALINYNTKEAKRVVYLFLIYYGLTFVVGNVGNDAERYALSLRQNAELPFSDFFNIIGGLYGSQTTVDIVQPLISFIVSRFTSHHSLLFASFAALFGFFYLKSINLLYKRYYEKPGLNALIHLAFFAMILPIMAINGFRMWTAAWIFFFGAYHVILYRNPVYFILTLSSCLVHYSFLSVNAVLIIYYFAGNRNIVYLPLAVLSFILPNLLMPFFQSIFGSLGGALKARAEMYANDDVILARQESFEDLAWFMKIGNDLVLYYLLFGIIFIQVLHKDSMKDQPEKNLFSFLLLFLAFVNFGKVIPSFGGRFQVIFFMFATLFIFLYLVKLPGRKINLLTLVGLFPMLLYAAIAFRQGADSINAWILTPGIGLPLLAPLSLAEVMFY
jgi:hypothetical protein